MYHVLFAATLVLPQLVAGWGADVHPTIGYLAETFLLDASVLPLSQLN
jgi:hypothetical protein